MIEYIAAAAFLIIFGVLIYKIAIVRSLKAENIRLKGSYANLEQEYANFQLQQKELLENNIQLEANLTNSQKMLDQLNEQIHDLTEQKQIAEAEKYATKQREVTLNERLSNMQKQMQDWQEDKETHIQSAKAFVAEATTKLTNDLLDKHKQETKAAKEDSEKQILKTTKELKEQFSNIFESINILNEDINKSKQTTDLIKNSLLSPTGAGSLAEITLENIFKASGLIENVDYFMQHWIAKEEGGYKPDAVVSLPNNSFIIIDSKASKFYIEIEQSSEGNSGEFERKLKASMNNHLKSLKSKNYKKAIGEGREQEIGYVEMLMFLPTDSALEKLHRIDKKFIEKAWKENILPVGPSGLLSHLLMANMKISDFKQFENSQVIINEVKNLISSIAVLNDHSQKIGKGIKNAFDNYDKFAASFNRNFLSKAKKLEKLGIILTNGENVKQLDRYHITATSEIIDAEPVDTAKGEISKIA